MAKKPGPPTSASWDVYKIAKKAVWLGAVEAQDKQAAVEKAAQEFKTEVWRLYAVGRRC
jgi:Ser/Thr protein kinase RdoA (MazF antagonist)